jgi:hypothetical protein
MKVIKNLPTRYWAKWTRVIKGIKACDEDAVESIKRQKIR